MSVIQINKINNKGIITINGYYYNQDQNIEKEEKKKERKKEELDLDEEIEDKTLMKILKETVIGKEEDYQDNISIEIDSLKKRIDEFNNNIAIYDDLIREEELRRTCGTGIEEGWITTLQEWIGCKTCKLIYDSNKGFTGDILWTTLKIVNSIVLIIETTDGDVFGSYHSIIPTKQNYPVISDNAHFLFTFRNKMNIGHIKFNVLSTNNKLLDIYKGSKSWVFGIEKGFWIHSKQNKSYISSNCANGELTQGYEDPTGLGGIIFTGSIYPSRFTTKRVIGLDFLIEEKN
ncbi:hypothetical protein EDI_237750 [Entamoeba dispar SAW760]|uniref:TLDc domain-containing protein n=1 Tax=Entamoeba dispar (strain ATCC PRA-260 / SAW760) TaxID=370354 RepID=B0E888_ENTDS|nr:uncharacterized protein EDI_237750 [Entamoeba dispar SAW760]EDR29213.1 hypothetical protein EDI_237750 [Entamoeba dispar SAW760]|eukprot:EDR29213.1 hypothetical protein EDI_237750 [Entamoeba dispar SAW760]